MRLLLKILFAPVMLALILVVHFAAFLLSVSAGIFALAGTVFAILAAIIFFAVTARTVSSSSFSRSSSARSACRCWRCGCSGNCRTCDMPFKTGFTKKEYEGWSSRSSLVFLISTPLGLWAI